MTSPTTIPSHSSIRLLQRCHLPHSQCCENLLRNTGLGERLSRYMLPSSSLSRRGRICNAAAILVLHLQRFISGSHRNLHLLEDLSTSSIFASASYASHHRLEVSVDLFHLRRRPHPDFRRAQNLDELDLLRLRDARGHCTVIPRCATVITQDVSTATSSSNKPFQLRRHIC